MSGYSVWVDGECLIDGQTFEDARHFFERARRDRPGSRLSLKFQPLDRNRDRIPGANAVGD